MTRPRAGLRQGLRRGLVTGAVAGAASGLPSTVWALATGRDPLEPTRAAGRLLARRTHRDTVLLLAAGAVHATLSLGWGIVLAAVLPQRRAVPAGAVAGLLVAALDLGVVGRHVPAIRRLDPLPQCADHLVFGAVAGAALSRLRRDVPARPRS